MKNSIKRAQSQACLGFAERKNFRPLAKLKKLSLTLAALITAATGAWAQVTVTPVSGQTNQWTFTMPASNVELQVEYEPEFTAAFKAGNTNTIQSGKATVKLDGSDATPDADGKLTPVYEGQTITLTAAAGYKFKSVSVEKKGGAVDNTYQKWDADQKKLVATAMPTTATKVESASTDVSWSAGTYVVDGEVTINGKITLTGDVNLIIKDGAKLTAQRIIGDSKNLSIYGQAQMTGELVVNCSNNDAFKTINTLEVHSVKVTATSSDDNCGGFYDIKTFNVYGGLVDAKCTTASGYGICLTDGGSMKIYGGEVKAEGKGNHDIWSYGILFDSDNIAPVTVYGGKLWAGSADKKAFNYVNLQKGAGFTGKIYTSSDNQSWAEYTGDDTPTTKYVRVGY